MKKIFAVICSLVLVDQVIKIFVDQSIMLNQKITVLPFLNITKTYNTGIAFSMFGEKQIIIQIMSVFILVYLIYLEKEFINKNEQIESIALAFVIAGAIGNLIDRVLNNQVIDYFQITLGNYQSAIFNFSDCLIVSGFLIILTSTLFQQKGR